MAKVVMNAAAINVAAAKAFKESMFLLGRDFTRIISAPGYFPSSGEDIVDTGLLRASQQLNFPNPYTAIFRWPVEYSAAVHNGARFKNGRAVIGRPWTRDPLSRSLGPTFNKILARKLG